MNTAELMSAVNFVEYAESCGLELEYKNGEYWGLSPFKEEKTPSFSINEESLPACEMPERSPFMSAMKHGTPA